MENVMTRSRTLRGKELEDYLGTVDFGPLNKMVQERYGIESEPEISVVSRGSCADIHWEEDVKNRCGILAEALRAAKIESFGAGVKQDYTYDPEKEKAFLEAKNYEYGFKDIGAVFGQYRLYANFSLRYYLIDGGSNGIGLFYAVYTREDGWTFTFKEA